MASRYVLFKESNLFLMRILLVLLFSTSFAFGQKDSTIGQIQLYSSSWSEKQDTSKNFKLIGEEKSDSIFISLFDLINSKLSELTLKEVIAIEKKMNSKDITPDHFIELGKDIYPNSKHFKLKTPKTFARIEDSTFTDWTEYYYTKKKGLVRFVLFEWNETLIRYNDFKFENKFDLKASKFQAKFDLIENILTNKLGKPKEVNIESKREKTFRDDVKWESANGLKTYLFMLGNDNGYRQICLALYKE